MRSIVRRAVRGLAHVATPAALLASAGCADPAIPSAPAAPSLAAVGATGGTLTTLGAMTGRGVSDYGTVAGTDIGPSGTDAYVWDQSTGRRLIEAAGDAWDISRNGHTIGGSNAAGAPVIWTSGTPAGPWTQTLLPDYGSGGSVRAIASDANGDPLVMTGNVWGAGGSNGKTPGKWERADCTLDSTHCQNGWRLTILPFAAPVTEGWGQDINPAGMVVGMEGTGCCRAMFWSETGAMTVLRGLSSADGVAAFSINDAGTVIVGSSGGTAAAWVRASTSDDFGLVTPTPLDRPASICKGGSSRAFAVTPDFVTAGTIVGAECGKPVAWKVAVSGGGISVQRTVLLASGAKTSSGTAYGINSTTSPKHGATGDVNKSGALWTAF